MARRRARVRAGRRLAVVEFEVADLRRLGLSPNAPAASIAAAVIAAIRGGAHPQAVDLPQSSEAFAERHSAAALSSIAPSTKAVPTAQGKPSIRSGMGGSRSSPFVVPEPPRFDPAQPFGEIRDDGRKMMVQNGYCFDQQHHYIGPA
jgi:hypothetical protein